MHRIGYSYVGLRAFAWADPITGYVVETVCLDGDPTDQDQWSIQVSTEHQGSAYVKPYPIAFAITPPEGPKSGHFQHGWISTADGRGHSGTVETYNVDLLDY